ncbi:DUF3800 domain-containing protein [Oceanobacillus halophilus]|uniref:DUF3800 domain-containing protein n=1 Tax=Oceanobacillus halophilus TaxID=930130 RepID=A0A495A574_9BACI|nr:DUF3800 domain-containing protein [Oceanobacillus halophilus]RKQ34683.1 DUF3800 domain-containing protein [Oceanobacillus halophilus]
MKEFVAFLEETGDYSLDLKHQGSKYFTVTAVIVEKIKLRKLKEKLSTFSDSPNMETIIPEIIDSDFHIYSFVINKRLLRKHSGLAYKQSFIRHLNGKLYKELYRTYENLEIIADFTETKEFLEAFKVYIEKNHIPNLFNQSEFHFSNTKEPELLQLVNLISRMVFTRYEQPNKKQVAFSLLKSKLIRVTEWPENSVGNEITLSKEEAEAYEDIIMERAVHLARDFIANYEDEKDAVIKDQVNFTKYLLFHLSLHPESYIATDEIIENLRIFKGEKVSKHYLRSNVVAPLRAKGVLIASSEKGYKLPISQKDLIDFVHFSSLRILPMIHRLQKCRDQILVATDKELDIMDYPEYKELKQYLDRMSG